MTVNTTDSTTVAARARYTTGFVTSQDGTNIGYRQFGHEPGYTLSTWQV